MWVVFSTGRFGQKLASFETECEAHDYIMRKKEVTFNMGFKKKFIEKECCETCKHRVEENSFMYDDYCDLEHWGEKDNENVNMVIDISKMKCNDWEDR